MTAQIRVSRQKLAIVRRANFTMSFGPELECFWYDHFLPSGRFSGPSALPFL